MTDSEQCGEVIEGEQCQLRVGHEPETHVVGRSDGPGRRSWLLGVHHDVSVPDSELAWADGFPQP